MFCKKLLWYYYSFGHNKFSELYTLFCYNLYIKIQVLPQTKHNASPV
jgi:hypothetical protein